MTNLTLSLVLPQPRIACNDWCESVQAQGFTPKHPASQPRRIITIIIISCPSLPEICSDFLLLHQKSWSMLSRRRSCPSGTTRSPHLQRVLTVLALTVRPLALTCATTTTRRCGWTRLLRKQSKREAFLSRTDTCPAKRTCRRPARTLVLNQSTTTTMLLSRTSPSNVIRPRGCQCRDGTRARAATRRSRSRMPLLAVPRSSS